MSACPLVPSSTRTISGVSYGPEDLERDSLVHEHKREFTSFLSDLKSRYAWRQRRKGWKERENAPTLSILLVSWVLEPWAPPFRY